MKSEYHGGTLISMVYRDKDPNPETDRLTHYHFLFINEEDVRKRLIVNGELEHIEKNFELVRTFANIRGNAANIIEEAVKRSNSGENVDFTRLLD